MTWWVKVDKTWRDTDDLTLDEVLAVEAVSGEPWLFLSPARSGLTAKALYAAFLVHDGATDEDAAKQVGAMTVKALKNRFRWREDGDIPDEWEDGLPVVDPKPAEATSTG